MKMSYLCIPAVLVGSSPGGELIDFTVAFDTNVHLYSKNHIQLRHRYFLKEMRPFLYILF